MALANRITREHDEGIHILQGKKGRKRYLIKTQEDREKVTGVEKARLPFLKRLQNKKNKDDTWRLIGHPTQKGVQ